MSKIVEKLRVRIIITILRRSKGIGNKFLKRVRD
jgi:hypothetical protein